MIFKRRDRRGPLTILQHAVYPKGGWARAFHYVKHRLNRLPDPPEKVARGIWAGVFTTFTPFYGLHFVVAALIATMIRGNILAALLGTFFGNPLTYLPIGIISLKTGHFMLGGRFHGAENSLLQAFLFAAQDLWANFGALFSDRTADWNGLRMFFHDVFLPYLVGGILPGLISATVCYYLSVPLIRAYQNRRRAARMSRWRVLKGRKKPADAGRGSD
ncbi:hypothetical protein SAMN05421688_2771 [Poseidonocella pacifica]|uniref:DUF2062 domain-containing protein n=1 Tax=Poseidonocella pacifica TaxID=871651 RepID=A0A1I0Y2W5_9RHOB|nr:DUF2062 domain-containing protein [Poseidonocella pacifica]SFB07661.1 hypothetical protein SAMN05421688_2771 [Poseidonocella pacifica]